MPARLQGRLGVPMRILATAIAAFVLTTAAAHADPVSSAARRFFALEPGGSAPPSPYDFGGDRCENAEPGARIWYGRFAGARNNGPGLGDGRKITHTSEGCFGSERACEAWMLALKTKYNARPIYNHCRPGYEPGSPV